VRSRDVGEHRPQRQVINSGSGFSGLTGKTGLPAHSRTGPLVRRRILHPVFPVNPENPDSDNFRPKRPNSKQTQNFEF
jgi:hypothetical protein